MKALALNLLTIVTLAFASNAEASGFKCTESEDASHGYNVKLFNKTTGATRTPSKLILSHSDAYPRTLLVRSADAISKTNRLNTVRYTVEGNAKTASTEVILQVAFKEGSETLLEGEVVPGQLIFVYDDSREVIQLDCERYLKGE